MSVSAFKSALPSESRQGGIDRPNIFAYIDIREFLRDWFRYQKSMNVKFSAHSISQQSGFRSRGYVSSILSGNRNLTSKALIKMGPHLGLESAELSYLELLRNVSESHSSDEREQALNRIQTFADFHQIDKESLESYHYLSKWYYPAIRELALLDDFKLDPIWIRNRLRHSVPLEDVIAACDFMQKYGLFEELPNGKVRVMDRVISCTGGLYRVALSNYYSELLDIAKEAIENTPRSQREFRGMIFPVSKSKYTKIQKKIDQCLKEIKELVAEADTADTQVYAFNQLLYPLTKDEAKND